MALSILTWPLCDETPWTPFLKSFPLSSLILLSTEFPPISLAFHLQSPQWLLLPLIKGSGYYARGYHSESVTLLMLQFLSPMKETSTPMLVATRAGIIDYLSFSSYWHSWLPDLFNCLSNFPMWMATDIKLHQHQLKSPPSQNCFFYLPNLRNKNTTTTATLVR
jgi:hypothetical protein